MELVNIGGLGDDEPRAGRLELLVGLLWGAEWVGGIGDRAQEGHPD